MSEIIKIQKVMVSSYNPKEMLAEFEIYYLKNNKQELIKKEYPLKNPLKLTHQIILDVKSKNKIIFEEELEPLEALENYSPIKLENYDDVEEKLFSFLKELCEKSKKLQNSKDAGEHMRLFDQFKTGKLNL